MNSPLEKKIRTELRGSAQLKSNRSIIVKMGEVRRTLPTEKYTVLINQFRLTAPNKAAYYANGGRKNFSELLWNGNIPTTTLSKEIKFSTAWLLGHIQNINNFIAYSKQIEDLILSSKYQEALDEIESFIRRHGWSFWATELYFFLIKSTHGFEKLKLKAESLAKASGPRISALVSLFLLDRNDQNYSADAFFSKWKETFVNLRVSNSMKNYLSYRSITQLDNLEEGLADCLSFDTLNSIYDCYLTLVDACATTIIEELSTHAQESAIYAANTLLDHGVIDHRLSKIIFLSGNIKAPAKKVKSNKNDDLYNFISHKLDSNHIDLPQDIAESIIEIERNGAAAEESINTLFHFGLNTKALDIGNILIALAFKSAEDNILSIKSNQWLSLRQKDLHIEDVLALNGDASRVYLQELCKENHKASTRAQAEYILQKLNSNKIGMPEIDIQESLLFWLGLNLVQQGRCDESRKIIKTLSTSTEHWQRQARKLNIFTLVTEGDIASAVNVATAEICKNQRHAYELALPIIFKRRKWIEFKKIDPIKVAIASYSCNLVDSDPPTQYICRMACRSVYKNENIDDLEAKWAEADSDRKKELILFFKEIWTEENLSLTEISTSQQARLVRLKVLQKLFIIDPANEKEYAEEIKALTLHETLWLGLKHINESRIFVNEPAIQRWAEKELAHDFDRWKKADTSGSLAEDLLKEILISYLTEQDTQTFKKVILTENHKEEDILLVSIVERLLRRFLLDPADGLNPYLSSRIRHGSLKGTILGPLEESGLLLTSNNPESLDHRYIPCVSISKRQIATQYIYNFSQSISLMLDQCNKDVVRIQTPESPTGKISVNLDKGVAARVYSEAARVANLPIFSSFCFETFWIGLRPSLEALTNFFTSEFKAKIQSEFDNLIERITSLGSDTVPLITTLRGIATSTQLQCDAVAGWFLPEKELEQRIFTLNETIEIALRATKNVYRLFDAGPIKEENETLSLALTTYGLTTVADCLYIILENSWKHSGFGSSKYTIEMKFCFDEQNSTLRAEIKSPLSHEKLHELQSGRLSEIRKKYENGSNLEMASGEGGSGIPKLAKLSRLVDRLTCPSPLSISIDSRNMFTVDIYIPLYKRGDAYDAYSQ